MGHDAHGSSATIGLKDHDKSIDLEDLWDAEMNSA
jgi:hypothetical protein